MINFSTGKAASSLVTDFLLAPKSVGSYQKLKFISECSVQFLEDLKNWYDETKSWILYHRELFSSTGEMLKTDKSALAKILKSEVNMFEIVQTDVEITDVFYCLYLILSPKPQTFVKIA